MKILHVFVTSCHIKAFTQKHNVMSAHAGNPEEKWIPRECDSQLSCCCRTASMDTGLRRSDDEGTIISVRSVVIRDLGFIIVNSKRVRYIVWPSWIIIRDVSLSSLLYSPVWSKKLSPIRFLNASPILSSVMLGSVTTST